jgi:hypothetical protein
MAGIVQMKKRKRKRKKSNQKRLLYGPKQDKGLKYHNK